MKFLKNKKLLLIIGGVLALLIVGVLLFVFVFNGSGKSSEGDNTMKKNENKQVIKKQEVKGLTVNEIDVNYSKDNSTFKAEITNDNKEAFYLSTVNVKCMDKDGNVIIVLTNVFDKNLASGEKVTFDVGTNVDLGKVEKVEYEVISEKAEATE